MKKIAVLMIMLIAFYGSAFAQGGIHDDYIIQPNGGGTSFYVQSTGKDTSLTYPTAEVMSVRFYAKDTTSVGADSDSSAVKYSLQIRPDTNIVSGELGAWRTLKTWSIDRDSVVVDTTITDIPVPNARHCRFIVEGLAGNKKLWESAFQIVLMNYYSVRSR
jgi:hypothetical protein